MKIDYKNFSIKTNKEIPVDEFVDKVLYDLNYGYYSKKIPFGKKGDFITAPTISNLFSEIIAIWIISFWEKIERPKKFNFVELGPGDGSLSRVLLSTFKKFPEFNKAVNIFLYEKSKLLIKTQKNIIQETRVKWINNFSSIKKGPVVFFGNEFFDAVPIKQFSKNGKSLMEKCYLINSKGFHETFRIASRKDIKNISSYKSLNGSKFIEYPKLGLSELDKIVKKISILNGGILLIDYGHLNQLNKNTLQAVKNNKKMNMKNLLKHLGKADITSLVNFSLLREYFEKKKLNVKKVVSQKFFLERMGIVERAKILEKKMTSKQKKYTSETLKRLLNKECMGELFKVIFAFKSKTSEFFGFN